MRSRIARVSRAEINMGVRDQVLPRRFVRMKDRPEGVDEPGLRRALSAWEIDAVTLAYAPVGFGDYHWTAVDASERPWFVTVADLANKGHCGAGTEAAGHGLRRAMDTAWALRTRSSRRSPVAGRRGRPCRSAGGRRCQGAPICLVPDGFRRGKGAI